MPSPALIDVASLIGPISEDNSVGVDIRQDTSPTSLYNQIKDARSAARAAERHSLFDGGSNEAMENWYKILELAPEILQKHSKDLEVASWYTEALIRRSGFQGLRDGFTIIRSLIDNYWDALYPLPDEEDGMETRTAPLTGLNGEGAEGVLIAPIRNVTLTEAGSELGPFNFWQYKQALDIQKIQDEDDRSAKAAKVGFTIEDIENDVASTDAEFYINMRDDVSVSIKEFREISRALDELCGTHEAPPTSNIINTLEDALSVIKYIARFKLPVESSNEDDIGSEEAGNPASSSGAVIMPGGTIKNREEAFLHLKMIANFFRQTEPHSPISYMIDKAVRWGDLSLDELMKELIPDSSSRDFYGSLTGVRSDDD